MVLMVAVPVLALAASFWAPSCNRMTAGLVISSPALPFQYTNRWQQSLVDNKCSQDLANICAAAQWQHK